MVQTAQKTLYATDLTLHMLAGKSYKPLPNTTLNEKYTHLTEMEIPTNSYPKLKYLVVGNGGDSFAKEDGKYSISQHTPIDGALFNQIPFVIRRVNNDISDAQKANYRMRVISIINNVTYAAYYMKVLPDMDIPANVNKITTNTNSSSDTIQYSSITVFDTNEEDILNPRPRYRNINFNSLTNTTRVSRLAKVLLQLTEYDLSELHNSLTTLGYTNSNIREIGLCSGWEITANGLKDVIGAQILFHIGMNIDTNIELHENKVLNKVIELGGEEPLVY